MIVIALVVLTVVGVGSVSVPECPRRVRAFAVSS
jgi:hypothetical protein